MHCVSSTGSSIEGYDQQYNVSQHPRVVSSDYFLDRGLSFDMAFLDGDHDQTSVMRDFLALKPMMRPAACVIFDDVDKRVWPGTYKAVHKLKLEAMRNSSGTVLIGDQTALFIDRGLFGRKARTGRPRGG